MELYRIFKKTYDAMNIWGKILLLILTTMVMYSFLILFITHPISMLIVIPILILFEKINFKKQK